MTLLEDKIKITVVRDEILLKIFKRDGDISIISGDIKECYGVGFEIELRIGNIKKYDSDSICPYKCMTR